ncbi:MAG TPA: L,D-transpeptidase family protein [Solirubrobacteraceae bacterium]|nr:L,D-transpeptidase family protein [Solirubrobacteraceae bacterium]
MTRSRLLALPAAFLALAPVAVAAPKQVPQPAPKPTQPTVRTIAPGVKAGGVDLGGQTVEQATQTLQGGIGAQLTAPVDVAVGATSFRLDPVADGKLAFDAVTTAKRAYYAGRDKGPNSEVELALRWSNRALQAWAKDVRSKTDVAGRDATVRITVRKMILTRSKMGRAINDVQLARRVAATLGDTTRPRVLRQRLRKIQPAVTDEGARRRYGTVVTVDRNSLKLRLFKRLKLSKTYGIAIGAAGNDTPAGLFNIQSKQVNPAWHVPNSDWAGSLQGQTIPGGAPNNPLKARWLGVNGAVGIHGTAEEWSIGSRASHGCIRMRVRDVVDLYPRVPMGAPVLIK